MADTGWVFVNSASEDTTGDHNWSGETNIFADDFAYASSTSIEEEATTNNLLCTMGTNQFTIPVGSTIDGIEVECYADAGSGDYLFFNSVRLIIGGTISGSNYATSNLISTSWELFTWGGSTNTWGLTIPPTVGQCNATDFGVALKVEEDGRDDGAKVYIDYVRLKVHYTEAVGGSDLIWPII